MLDTADKFQQEFNVSRETMLMLTQYLVVLRKWNPKINLVSKSTLENAWARHFSDSAQLWAHAPENIRKWVDIGSGAGFPALVIAAIAAEKNPNMTMTVVESDRRKSVFMSVAANEMGIKLNVITERIENIPALEADVLSARALSSLTNLMEFAQLHRKPEGICLFPKGVRADLELTEAATSWHISHQSIPSLTDSDAVILKIGAFERAN